METTPKSVTLIPIPRAPRAAPRWPPSAWPPPNATDRNGETRENTEWHSIVAWRSNADLVEKFVHKGSQIYIEGKLRTRQWTDQTGAKRFTTEIQADNIQLLGKRPDAPQQPNGYQGQAPAQPAYQAQPAPAYQPPVQPQQPAAPEAPDDDLPF